MTPFRAAVCLALAMSFTGANVPIGKVIVGEFPILSFLALRFALSAATLALLALRWPERSGHRLEAQDFRDVTVLALVGSVLFTFFMLEGARRTAASEAGIITATIPAVVTLFGCLAHRRWPGRPEILAIGLATAGLAVVQAGAAGGQSSLAGNALVGLAVVCEAIFVIASQRASGRWSPIRLSLLVSLASLLIVLPFALPELLRHDWSEVSAAVWLLAVWYTLASSVFCTILWYAGAAHAPTWIAGLATAMLPVTALVVSAMALGEPIGPLRAAGAALVLRAIVAGALSQRRM